MKLEELYDIQGTVGAKLESVLAENGYTKVDVCAMSGISRPTLDKLLAGNISSRTNYVKHIEKVLGGLKMTADMLMGNVRNSRSQVRALRQIMRMDEDKLAAFLGTTTERIRDIESGADAEMAELRDIAAVLHTSVACIMGENIFPVQNRYWGHMGIRLNSSRNCCWYPITEDTKNSIYRLSECEQMVVPCMNNKVLLINMKNVAEIILLDDACDEPYFVDWDSKVDCGEIPLVMYEAYEDYLAYHDEGKEPPKNEMSEKFVKCMDNFFESIPGEKYFALDEMRVCYPDGVYDIHPVDFQYSEVFTSNIYVVYDFEEPFEDHFLYFQDYDGNEVFLNKNAFAFIELPLLKLENAIYEGMEEDED